MIGGKSIKKRDLAGFLALYGLGARKAKNSLFEGIKGRLTKSKGDGITILVPELDVANVKSRHIDSEIEALDIVALLRLKASGIAAIRLPGGNLDDFIATEKHAGVEHHVHHPTEALAHAAEGGVFRHLIFTARIHVEGSAVVVVSFFDFGPAGSALFAFENLPAKAVRLREQPAAPFGEGAIAQLFIGLLLEIHCQMLDRLRKLGEVLLKPRFVGFADACCGGEGRSAKKDQR